jgi:hypothetical protein
MRNRIFLPLLLFVLFVASCGKQQPGIDPTYPNSDEMKIVTLHKVLIHPDDFSTALLGAPLKIKLQLFEDGHLIKAARLRGTRGERNIPRPIDWIVHFSKKSNYQLVVSESSILASTKTYLLPEVPKVGNWPLAANNGEVEIGEHSILYFKEALK